MKHHLQTIRGLNGQPEYILLPVRVYEALRAQIQKKLDTIEDDYVAFNPEDFVSNPVALIRMRAGVKQAELAKRLNVSQAYISKIEKDSYNVTAALLQRVKDALK